MPEGLVLTEGVSWAAVPGLMSSAARSLQVHGQYSAAGMFLASACTCLTQPTTISVVSAPEHAGS